MNAALVVGDQGLVVRRFACASDARNAQAPIESDGIGASLMRRVCAWCKADLGAVVCVPAMAGKVSHGICEPCKKIALAELNVSPSPAVPASAAPLEVTGPAALEDHPETSSSARSTAPARPGEAFKFHMVTGRDFGRAIAWARRQPNALAEAIRRKLGGRA